MKTLLITILIAYSLMSCQSAKDQANESVTSALEGVIKSQTGQDMDLVDADSYMDQKVTASFIYDGNEQLTNAENFSGSIVISKSADGLNISFQLVNESGTSLMGVFSNFDEGFKLPLVAKFTPSNAPSPGFATGTLVLMKLSESGMQEVPMPFEGTMTMLSLNDKVAEFEINAKGGPSQNTNKPDSWKSINGKVTITKPAIQSMGIKKEEIFK
jgi:hypothetical protein